MSTAVSRAGIHWSSNCRSPNTGLQRAIGRGAAGQRCHGRLELGKSRRTAAEDLDAPGQPLFALQPGGQQRGHAGPGTAPARDIDRQAEIVHRAHHTKVRRCPRGGPAQRQRNGRPGETARQAGDIARLIRPHVVVDMLRTEGEPGNGPGRLGHPVGLQQHEVPLASETERVLGVLRRATDQLAFNRTQLRRGRAVGDQQEVVALSG